MSMPGYVSIAQCVLVRTFYMQPSSMNIVYRQNSRDVGCGHISLRCKPRHRRISSLLGVRLVEHVQSQKQSCNNVCYLLEKSRYYC